MPDVDSLIASTTYTIAVKEGYAEGLGIAASLFTKFKLTKVTRRLGEGFETPVRHLNSANLNVNYVADLSTRSDAATISSSAKALTTSSITAKVVAKLAAANFPNAADIDVKTISTESVQVVQFVDVNGHTNRLSKSTNFVQLHVNGALTYEKVAGLIINGYRITVYGPSTMWVAGMPADSWSTRMPETLMNSIKLTQMKKMWASAAVVTVAPPPAPPPAVPPAVPPPAAPPPPPAGPSVVLRAPQTVTVRPNDDDDDDKVLIIVIICAGVVVVVGALVIVAIYTFLNKTGGSSKIGIEESFSSVAPGNSGKKSGDDPSQKYGRPDSTGGSPSTPPPSGPEGGLGLGESPQKDAGAEAPKPDVLGANSG
jgi:hypothetical protein